MKGRAVALSVLVVLAVVGVTSPAIPAAFSPGVPGMGGQAAASTAASNNTSVGSQVSSFMQASAGQADAAVETGMWEQRFQQAGNNTSKARAVEQRAAAIERQLQRLKERKQRLKRLHENGTISDAAYRAQMSNVVARLAALNRSLTDLTERAKAVGANVSRVEAVQEQARELAQGMGDVTRAMPGGPPEGVPGPPANRSGGPGDPPTNRTDPGNRSTPRNGTGEGNGPDDRRNRGPGNRTNTTAVTGPPPLDR